MPPTPPVAEELLSESDLVSDATPCSRGPSTPLQPRLSTPPPVPRRPAPAPLPPPVEETTAKPGDPPIEQGAPVALPSEAPRPAAPPAVVFLPLVVGLVIFVVGLALYFWAS